MKKNDLILHHKNELQLLDKLETFKLEHVPRSANKMADALANFAATLALGAEESITIPVCGQWIITSLEDGDAKEVKTVSGYEIDEKDYRQLLIDYLEHGKLSSELKHKTKVQQRASRFLYYKGTLY